MNVNEITAIYTNARIGKISKKTAIEEILKEVDNITIITEDSIEITNRKIEKVIYYIKKLLEWGNNDKVYDFLESEIISDDYISIRAKRGIYNILEQHYPNKLRAIQEYILRNYYDFFNTTIEYDAKSLIKYDLVNLFFRAYKLMEKWYPADPLRYSEDYHGFMNNDILIVNEKHDPFINSTYKDNVKYNERGKWKTDTINSIYNINDKSSIEIRHLLFSVNLFKKLVEDFNDNKVIISFSMDFPIQIKYKNNPIKIYI